MLVYLGSPYSRYPGGLDEAARLAETNAGLLMKAGYAVFCPIAHCHNIAKAAGIDPRDDEFWVRQLAPYLDIASVLVVLEMDGWQASKGLTYEREQFAASGRRIVHMTPGIVPEIERDVAA